MNMNMNMNVEGKVISDNDCNPTKRSVEAVVENGLKKTNQPAEPRYLQWGCIQEQLPLHVPNIEWTALYSYTGDSNKLLPSDA